MNLSTLNPNELVGPSGRNVQSAYFDGAGDSLTVADNAAFDIGSGAFTLEAFVYLNALTNFGLIIGQWGTGGNNAYVLRQQNSILAPEFIYTTNGTTEVIGARASTALRVGTWTHLAVVRDDSSTLSLFVNGSRAATNSSFTATIFNSSLNMRVGGEASGSFTNGYICDVRLVKGTAVYDPTQTSITVPTAPLTPIANTSFLLGFSEYRFIDQSPNNFTITRNGDTTQSTFGPYGNNWSNYFDGVDDYLRIAPGAAFAFGTGDFTVELWVYPTKESAQIGGGIRMIDARNASQTTAWIIGTNLNASAGNAFQLGWFDGSVDFISTGTLTKDGWNHVVYTRSGTTGSLFLNGARVGTRTDSVNYSISPTQSTIGARFDGTLYATTGYISNIRTVKGTSVYDPTQTTLTVPTSPLPVIPNTSLLTCQSNRFLDSSPNNFTITANGNVSAQFYGPFAGPVPEPVVDVYTTTGVANTWIKRPGAKAVQMIAIGAGGGGGGGMGSASGVQRNGGAGGGGGANGQIIYTADQLPSTLYIRVGASGTGGASNTSGGAGGNSTIAAADPIISSTSVYCMGGGGGGGEAGAASSSSVGGGGGGTAGAGTTGTGDNAVSGGLPAVSVGFSVGGGGAGGGNGAAGTTSYAAEWGGGGGGGVRNDGANRQPGGGSLYGGGGGGVGGFVNSTGGAADGICGGASGRYTFGTDQSNFGGGAAGAGSAGGAGANASTLYAAGSGGGGGGVSGFAGGAGGFPGGGGGGGGASTTTGGTGGVGGAGRVVLITFF